MTPAMFRSAVLADLGTFQHDPLGFVRYAFPWGEGELEGEPGPDEWQVDMLTEVGERMRAGETLLEAVQFAVASGHGVGKSALVAWLILWAMSTFEDTRGVVTANTDTQLRTKTWPEVTKWYRLSINAFMFTVTATAIYSLQEGHEKNWRVDLVPWSETNTEAFAGLHNKGKRILLLFDEGSAIPDVIYEVAEGALTDSGTEILWGVFGNPTRNTGRFRECFGRLKHRWITRQIDSRTARMANKAQIAKWVEDYGEDSDFVRVRVRGVFPRAGSSQFIDADTLEAARTRPVERDTGAPVIMGVDVARFGDDQSVILFRQGRDARSIPAKSFRGIDTMALASKVVWWAQQVPVRVIFIDGNGVGGGVVDRVRQLTRVPVIEVQAGGKARNERDYVNRTAESWDEMRRWLKDGGAIEDTHDLVADLGGREYGFDGNNRLQLEKKDDMKKRGLASPDYGDALALTFAEPVGRIDVRPQQVQVAETEYPVFG